MSDTAAELGLLTNIFSAGAILLEVVKRIKIYYEKKRVRQAFWNLIEGYADRYEEAYDNLMRILGKMIGYAVFLSTDEYKKELDELTREFDENLEIMIDSLYKIVESIAVHKDTLKTVLSKEDWLIIDHVSSTYTDGKVNWVKLIDPGFMKLLLGENYSVILSREMSENFSILSSEINKIFEKHGLEIFIRIGEKLRDDTLKYMGMMSQCILTKILECVTTIIDSDSTKT